VTPLEALQAVCEAWNRLDIDALAVLFAADGRFEDPLLPAPATGPDGVREASAGAMAELSSCEVTLTNGLEQGDRGIAEGTFASTLAESGARLDFPFVMAVDMRDGKIARLAEYFDTAPLV
jgi:ketosteroid isomerase-like protein